MKIIKTSILILFFSFQSFSQEFWQVIHQPTVNPYSLSVSSKGNVFAVRDTGLIRSTDHGESWEYICFAYAGVGAFGTSPTGVLYLISNALRKSTDEGNTWITLNMPIPAYKVIFEPNPIMTNSNGDIFIQMDNYPNKDTYRSTDEGNSWVTIGADSSIMIDIIFKDNLCFASFLKSGYGYLYKSSNNGDDWEIISTAPTYLHTLFAAKNGKLYGGRTYGGPGELFTSSDNGINWEVVSEFNSLWVADIQENQLGHIFVATGYGIYRSTDDGNSWHHYNSGLNHTPSFRLAVDSLGYVYVGTGLPQMLYGSIQSTIPVELTSFSAKQVEDKIHLNWQTATELNNHGFEIERKTENSEWRTKGFKEGNGTTTETQFYSFIDDNISGGKFQYRLKQIDYDGSFEFSDEIEIEVSIPIEYSLSQNFPNPFNPSTVIKYSIPEERLMILKVFNAIGEEVVSLVNEVKQPGVYEIEFNASYLSSGIYFYKLRAGDFVETKKMILLK
jgi:photosystem II stability/assembly factor-like uncharacterized protein